MRSFLRKVGKLEFDHAKGDTIRVLDLKDSCKMVNPFHGWYGNWHCSLETMSSKAILFN